VPSQADATLDETLTLDLGTLARLLGVSRASLQRASANGSLRLPVFPLGGRKLFVRTSDVRALLASVDERTITTPDREGNA
jgi:hypothetical protein